MNTFETIIEVLGIMNMGIGYFEYLLGQFGDAEKRNGRLAQAGCSIAIGTALLLQNHHLLFNLK